MAKTTNDANKHLGAVGESRATRTEVADRRIATSFVRIADLTGQFLPILNGV
jgi:hypothetical protein